MAAPRILLVDDEDALRQLLANYLVRIGYQVDTASTAEQALEMFQRDTSAYALLLVDLSLPGMSGDELMQHVLATGTQAQVLLSSGYYYDMSYLPEEDRKRASFLQKPYLPRQLADQIRKLLPG